MKKARTRLFAMTLAIIIFSLCAFPASAQTVFESASQFLRIQAAVRLTAAEEAEVKEAVLNNEINESNQENILKLAMKQYLNRNRTAQATLSSTTNNDEWIILQEVETEEFTPLNSVLFNQPREKKLVATAFLVQDENGEKVTPSEATANSEVVVGPYDSYVDLSQYYIGGQVTTYITGQLMGFADIFDKIRVDRIITSVVYPKPNIGAVKSFTHSVSVNNLVENFYWREDTVNGPVSGRDYTLSTTGMGFRYYTNGWTVSAAAFFQTNTPKKEISILINMYQLLKEHSSDYVEL